MNRTRGENVNPIRRTLCHAWAWPGHPRLWAASMIGGWVYITTNHPNRTLYIGVTSNIARRAWEHRQGTPIVFTARYRLTRLVYAEPHEDVRTAIQREKTLKHWPRAWKVRLIVRTNPDWSDLYEHL